MRRVVATLNLGIAGLLLATVGMAESPAGMVQSRGNVSINGKAVSESSNLFNGDRIQTTGADSGANILANSQHMMVMGNSTVIYRDNDVTVECGGLLVTLLAAATAHVNGVTFRASQSGQARFEFHQARGSYQITDREGSISYDDGTGERNLTTGQSDRHAGGGEACSLVAGPITNNPAPVQGGMSVGGGISDKVAWAAGAGSAFAAICAVECRSHHRNVSPAAP